MVSLTWVDIYCRNAIDEIVNLVRIFERRSGNPFLRFQLISSLGASVWTIRSANYKSLRLGNGEISEILGAGGAVGGPSCASRSKTFGGNPVRGWKCVTMQDCGNRSPG